MTTNAFWLPHVALTGLFLGFTPTIHAQAQTNPPEVTHPLRERIKDKLQERRANQAPAPQKGVPLTEPGTYRFSLQHGGQERAYMVHLPQSYRPGTPMAVVFAFHGGGGNMTLQASDNYGLVAKAESAGFVAVFPNGYSRFPGGKLATWNAGNCCGQARDAGMDDVGFVRAIWTQLEARISADTARVFATGMSNGGMLSHRLACDMADVFRAVAPVAGTDGTLACQPSRPVSVLHIHARDDTHVLFNGGAGADAFKDTRKVADFVSVPETMDRWRQRNQCTGAPQRVLSVTGAHCDAYTTCAGGTQVQLCVTDAGGHSWPGGTKPRASQTKTSQALSANEVMWDFFLRVGPR